ncbi:MAG TPA: hypothetical protein VI756_16060 [Blastocatellia bacterium]
MNAKRIIVVCSIAVVCLLSSGCISFEEEVFLNPDGTGEFVLQLSMPDFPENMTKAAPGGGAEKSPQEQLADLKKQLTTGLPSSVSLEQMKEVRENGALGFYAIFRFKDIKDIEPALAALGKGSSKDGSGAQNSQFKLALQRTGDTSVFNSSVYYNIQDISTPAGGQAGSSTGGGLDEQLKPLLMGMIRMRFVLHAPRKIKETNADIVLHDNVAIWNSSMIAFLNNKKPIEMKATY